MRRQLHFAEKITLLITALVTVSGVGITAVAAYRFRTELYAREFSSAFTVYMAAANYLSAHHRTHHGYFETRSLDFVFSRKFLRIEGEAGERITHRPSHLSIYDGTGKLLYEYSEDRRRSARRELPRGDLPVRYRERYDRRAKAIEVAGLLSPDGDVPGFVFITFPTDIESQVFRLYRDTFLIMLAVLAGAVAVSGYTAQRVLTPVEDLIRAAKRVHGGDLDQHVIVAGHDEIGLLAQTFNEMVGSLGRRIALMHRMQAWTMDISRVFDEKPLYGSLMEMCGSLSSAQAFRLYLKDVSSGELTQIITPESPMQAAPCDESFVRRAAQEGRVCYLDEEGHEQAQCARPVEMAIPLRAGKSVIGAIWIGRPREGGAYQDETVTILQTLAQYGAVAIENVKLYKELTEKERYEREMALARQIQVGMLPRAVPDIGGFEVFGLSRPAFEVGGDYFDYIPAGDGRWHLVIGDVSGKGVAAALIVSIVRTLLRTCVQFEKSARQALKWVNHNLTPDLKSDMFFTATMVTLSPDQSRVRVVRAGHEPLLVLRRSGAVESLAPKGVALGILDLQTFDGALEETELELGKGDTLLLYTDGVTEALSMAEEEFGPDRLRDVAGRVAGEPASDVVDAVLAYVTDFSAGRPQNDDMTLVALRRTS